MTRRSPPDSADPPFGDAVGPVRPLRAQAVLAAAARPARRHLPASASESVALAPAGPVHPGVAVDALTVVCLRRPGVQDRALRALRARAFRAQDECDLHGLTAPAAAGVLDAFLAQASVRGLSRLRVIHGRGQGVLKNLCVAQLAAHPAVLAAVSAGPADGGVGALRVLLRTRRAEGSDSP